MQQDTINLLMSIVAYICIGLFLIASSIMILYKIYNNKISLDDLLAEPNQDGTTDAGKASLSRFQFLIFTFVIAGLFLLLCVRQNAFVLIPDSVLILLGISGGVHLVSKGISQAGQTADTRANSAVKIATTNVATAAAGTVAVANAAAATAAAAAAGDANGQPNDAGK